VSEGRNGEAEGARHPTRASTHATAAWEGKEVGGGGYLHNRFPKVGDSSSRAPPASLLYPSLKPDLPTMMAETEPRR